MATPKKKIGSSSPSYGIGAAAISRTPKGQKPDRFASFVQRMATKGKR